jgi:predicted amidophosphoribosyltransferase
VAHAGPARELVLALKLGGALPAADAMAAQIAARLPRELADGATLVAVPPAPARRRRRGFDHAERLARSLADRTGCQVADCLRRDGPAARQVGQGRRARAAQVHVRAHGKVPTAVLLVDDVHTTGSTLRRARPRCGPAGPAGWAAVTYARTLSGP